MYELYAEQEEIGNERSKDGKITGRDVTSGKTGSGQKVGTRMKWLRKLLIALTLTGGLWAQTGNPIPATVFGLHVNHGTSDYPIIPFGTFRFWDNSTRWQLINTSLGVYSWTQFDAWMNVLGTNGVKDAMYELGGTPQWASSVPTDGTCDYVANGKGYCDAPSDLNTDGTGADQLWRLWVAAVAQHAKASSSGVHMVAWCIWNEWPRQPGHTTSTVAWNGQSLTSTQSNAQMLRLAQDARCIITGRGSVTATGETCAQVQTAAGISGAVDSTAIMLAPSIGPDNSFGVSVLNSYIAAGGNTPSEAYALHTYASGPSGAHVAETVYNAVTAWHQQLTSGEQSKPYWSTEGGWGQAAGITDPDMQAAFVARYYLWHWSAGTQRVYWYSYDNAAWGLLWAPGTGLTSAGLAYQVTDSWMSTVSMNFLCSGPTYPATGVYTCGFVQSNGTQMLAVWDSSQSCSGGTCTTSSYKFDPKFITSQSVNGTVATLSGSTVQIGAKPLMLFNVAGSVVLQGKIALH